MNAKFSTTLCQKGLKITTCIDLQRLPEVHGLDKCLDHGIDAFERYVGLAALSRNLQKLGTIKRDRERLRLFNEQQKLAA